ncbi:MAG: dehydrogenase subunit [Bacteroidetes bacterium]|nr:dehydrogenase subunit [Bacteroidota bacterium]
MEVTFYISSAIALLSTAMVITRLNAVQALLYLIVSLLAVALVFFELGAPFVAALEVIIYAGAIMVLFVFVMMMLNLGGSALEQERRWLNPRMYLGPVLLALALGGEMALMIGNTGPASHAIATVPPKEVGRSLYLVYPVAVELAAMLLLAGLVGAYHLGAGKWTNKEEEITPGFRDRKAPGNPAIKERSI